MLKEARDPRHQRPVAMASIWPQRYNGGRRQADQCRCQWQKPLWARKNLRPEQICVRRSSLAVLVEAANGPPKCPSVFTKQPNLALKSSAMTKTCVEYILRSRRGNQRIDSSLASELESEFSLISQRTNGRYVSLCEVTPGLLTQQFGSQGNGALACYLYVNRETVKKSVTWDPVNICMLFSLPWCTN